MAAKEPMTLCRETLAQARRFGLQVPEYDLVGRTVGIVHFGVGGFHRAHQAEYLDRLSSLGKGQNWAICGVGLLPSDAPMREVMRAQDCLYTLIRPTVRGTEAPRVIGSLVEYISAPGGSPRVFARMTDPRVRVVSLTVTERGYHCTPDSGELVLDSLEVQHDLNADLEREEPSTVLGYLVEGLRRRRAEGAVPFTVLSCDNMRGNGDITRRMVLEYAQQKHPELVDWLAETVSFPNSMVDRITPRTTQQDIDLLRDRWGVKDMWPVISEDFSQWVIEDRFPAGRPALEEVGVEFVDDVEPYEMAKLRLLNCSHQVLAHVGALLGYTYVHEVMVDSDVKWFLRHAYMDDEATLGIPLVAGLDAELYKDTVVERFENPHLRDTLSRLLAARRIPDLLVPLMRENLAAGQSIRACSVVIAAWATVEGHTHQDGLIFLEDTGTFGNLAEHEAVRAAYTGAVRAIRERGLRSVLRTCVGPGVE